MRRTYCTLTPGVIHQHARQALRGALDWRPYHRSVSVAQLLDLLLLMAATTASLFATSRRFFRFSHETARRAVRVNLPAIDRLTAGLVHSLHEVLALSRQDRRRHWMMAIDAHHVSYYGRRTPHVVGGPKKQGTKWSFGYATAMVLHDRRRYTVGLCPLEPGAKADEIVRTLLDQVAEKGLKLRGVALDSGFDSGEVLLLLQERRLAYVVPLRRRVRTRVLLWRGRRKTMALAFDGWGGGRAHNVHRLAERQRRLYRRRFGIETSYRQKNQAQAKTTSKDPTYRLLLEGIGYLLRQVWVILTELLARRRRAEPKTWVGALTMAIMLNWLADELSMLYPENRSIPLQPKRYTPPRR